MMELKPGTRLASAVCATEVIVVKAPGGDVEITCGGAAMSEPGGDKSGSPAAGLAEGTMMGKRYLNEDGSLEVLCTKPGDGSVGIGEVALTLQAAKPLPASD